MSKSKLLDLSQKGGIMSLQTEQLHKQFLKEYNGLCLKFDCEIKPWNKNNIEVVFNKHDNLYIKSKKP